MRAVLDGLRLTGAVFLRAEYTENWAFESMPVEDLASALVPDARRVTLVPRRRLRTVLGGGRAGRAALGLGGRRDRAAVRRQPPHGRPQRRRAGLGRQPRHAAAVVGDAGDQLRRGRRRHRRRLRLPHLRRPALRPRAARAASGVRGQPDHADGAGLRARQHRLRAAPDLPGRRANASRCRPRCPGCSWPRSSASTWPARPRRSRAGCTRCATRCSRPRSPRCTPIPGASGRWPSWRGPSLVSASSLDQRFRDVLGMPPIRYLTVWRMHTARSLLSSTRAGGRDGGAPGRLRLRGGVQPGLQARPRRLAGPVAGRRRTPRSEQSQSKARRTRSSASSRSMPSARIRSAYSCAACRAACSTPLTADHAAGPARGSR